MEGRDRRRAGARGAKRTASHQHLYPHALSRRAQVLLFLIADGHGGCEVSEACAEGALAHVRRTAAGDPCAASLRRGCYAAFRSIAAEIAERGSTSGSTLSVGCLNLMRAELTVANLGASAIYIVPHAERVEAAAAGSGAGAGAGASRSPSSSGGSGLLGIGTSSACSGAGFSGISGGGISGGGSGGGSSFSKRRGGSGGGMSKTMSFSGSILFGVGRGGGSLQVICRPASAEPNLPHTPE